ncbi:hypothetical protein SLS60_008088 [Paraconiothyrium brasiliense]|uniref:Uncharacterized protein n=1 Tax=Paraconiothyrium brasiliense TaxID=300254 RepID=A0ABR3R3F3_9PLEO
MGRQKSNWLGQAKQNKGKQKTKGNVAGFDPEINSLSEPRHEQDQDEERKAPRLKKSCVVVPGSYITSAEGDSLWGDILASPASIQNACTTNGEPLCARDRDGD